jgi:hypothetical protein
MERQVGDGWHAVAADREVFEGFGGGMTRRARMRPAGRIHAFTAASTETLCGQALSGLLVFPGRRFETEHTLGKCPDCSHSASRNRRRAAGH